MASFLLVCCFLATMYLAGRLRSKGIGLAFIIGVLIVVQLAIVLVASYTRTTPPPPPI